MNILGRSAMILLGQKAHAKSQNIKERRDNESAFLCED